MNKPTQHTPGPWTVVRLAGRTSFRLYHPDTTSEEAAEANAHLIAAAPELLEACKAFLEWERLDSDAKPAWLKTVIDNAESAIAKAYGGIPNPEYSNPESKPVAFLTSEGTFTHDSGKGPK